jgi:antitoxin (DNA-binding transcriptional repressor) of toxin-antitoxin stability system
MAVTNMRGLRDTRQIKAWLRAGETVEVLDRNQLVGRILPAKKVPDKKEWPDFEARRKKIFGDKVLPGADLLIEERGRY